MPIRLLAAIFIVTLLSFKAVGQDPVDFSFACVDADPGDEVCIPVAVTNFEDIISLFISFSYDPSVLRFDRIENDVLPLGSSSNPGPGEVVYLWTDPSPMFDGVTIPDGGVVFEICFEVIGIPGSSSAIDLTSNFNQEVSDINQVIPVTSSPCTVNVTNPAGVDAVITVCGSPDGVQPGSFTITIFGGTPPYNYVWTGPVVGGSSIPNSTDSETQNVPFGAYIIDIMDATGDLIVLNIDIPDNLFISTPTIVQEPTCYDFTNGRISIDATNGLPPYGIVWRNLDRPSYFGSAFIANQGGSTFLNSLPGGRYEIMVSDANGCSQLDTLVLNVDEFMIVANTTDATCNGSGDGSVILQISGSTPLPGGYDIETSWGDMETTDNYNSGMVLDPGTYQVTISDANVQCDTVFEFSIGSSTTITANIATTPTSCPGAADGQAQITPVPAGVYDFNIYDSLGTLLRSINTNGLIVDDTSGIYFLVLDDGQCRSDTIEFEIVDPDSIQIEIVDVTNTSCTVGSSDGSITVQASGGTIGPGSDYNYSWNGGAFSGSMISGLPAGNYTVTVTDDNNCSATASVTLTQSNGPQIVDVVATNLSCSGDPVTTLELIFTEGSGMVDFINWTDSEGNSVGNTAIITNQSGGDTLDILIRDENNCFDILNNYIVPGGNSMMIDSIRLESPSCPGEDDGQFTVFVSGGTEPYTYIWSTGDTNTFNLLPGLTAGFYGVTVVDADSCGIVDTTIVLQDKDDIFTFFTGVDSTGCGFPCSGTATANPGGGDPTLPFFFLWSDGVRDTGVVSSRTDLCAGENIVTVTQDNLCFYSDTVDIPSPSTIEIEVVGINNVSCSGAGDGFISLSATGGAGGYTYDWDSGLPPGPIQNNLEAGTYTVTVSDADLCSVIDSFDILEPDTLRLVVDSAVSTPVGCAGMNGVISLQSIGGFAPYEYTWSPDVSDGPIAQQLPGGTYSITVTDQAGCSDSITIDLVVPDPLTIYVSEVQAPTCAGETALVGVDSITGGRGVVTWSVNGGQQFSVDTMIELPVGFYNIIAQDEGDCRDTVMLTIDGPPFVRIDIFPVDPIVRLGDSIQLELVVSDTQGPVDSISWAHDEQGLLSCYDCTMPFASNLVPATYFVQVTDSAGCIGTGSIRVDVDNSRQVFLPNVFTPNRDGVNENFMIFTGEGVLAIPSVRVFDRWGEMVAEALNLPVQDDGAIVWDGTLNNQDMQPGVYVYVAEVLFLDQPTTPLIFKGDVTLLR